MRDPLLVLPLHLYSCGTVRLRLLPLLCDEFQQHSQTRRYRHNAYCAGICAIRSFGHRRLQRAHSGVRPLLHHQPVLTREQKQLSITVLAPLYLTRYTAIAHHS